MNYQILCLDNKGEAHDLDEAEMEELNSLSKYLRSCFLFTILKL